MDEMPPPPSKLKKRNTRLATFILGLGIGCFTGGMVVAAASKNTAISQSPIHTPTPTTIINKNNTGNNCIGPKLPGANNFSIFEQWKNPFIAYEENHVVYREVDVKHDVVCKYTLNIPKSVKQPRSLYLHEDEPFISYINEPDKTLHIYNIQTSVDQTLTLGASDSGTLSEPLTHQVYYDNYDRYIDGKAVGSTILVEPIVFYGGCEESCDQVNIDSLIREDWKKLDMKITIARTRGTAMQIPRDRFPVDYKFSSFRLNYDTQMVEFPVGTRILKFPFTFVPFDKLNTATTSTVNSQGNGV